MKYKAGHIFSWGAAALLLASCAVGPDYVRPATEQPKSFKEAQSWKQAEPKDTEIRAKWWEVFGDPELNKLEEQVVISNQNVKAAEASYRQAQALTEAARSSFFPVVSATASMSRGGFGGSSNNAATSGTTGGGNSGNIGNRYNAELTASWEPDLWGRIRRTVEENSALASASRADLGAATLSAQAALASDYLSLRLADEQKRLLDRTVENYKRALDMTQNLYHYGVNARSDYLQAKTQMETAQAQAIDIGVARAQYEHAIAMLIGKAPADFSIPVADKVPEVPAIPVGLPSDLLERRPDIAASERRVAAANANIGVTKAAFFPDITLSASGGYQSSSLAQWFNLPNRVWSIGPSLAETIFDAGLRRSQTQAAIAAYDSTVAAYRQTVLGSFQEVEDNLAALRLLEQEAQVQGVAVTDATTAAGIFMNQYKAGLISYLNVVTAQNTQLSNELTALNIRKQRLIAAATLIKALGGGWNAMPVKQ
ncbi:MAG TPA: efflux transporter outer membrane subunit [Rickettsiales bacterium]|nr:efflux transporter outer membrane subunit [Rickettsiales bacterium]